MRFLTVLSLVGSLIAPSYAQEKADENVGTLPKEVRELAEKGGKAFSERKWKEAKEAYEKIIKIAPDNALAHANLGATEYRLRNTKSAEKHLEKAVLLNGNLAQTWITLGLLCLSKDDNYKAASALSRAVHEDPENARARQYLAVAMSRLGWTTGAEAEFKKALKLNPEYAEAHFNLALMFLNRDPPAKELARRHYFKAVDLGSKPDKELEKEFD